MAGDWMAVRLDIHDDPAVVSIASALDISPDCVVGKLTRLWSWANRHLQTGVAKGVTSNWIDQYVHATGFAAAMCETGWLQDRSGAIHFPKFDVWNSASAKRRLLKTRQKHKERIDKPVAKMSSSHDDKKATREEKRREENTPLPLLDDPRLSGLPDSLKAKGFMESWLMWEDYQKQSGKGVVQPITKVQNWHDLGKIGAKRAEEAIRLAIGKQWRTLVIPDMPKTDTIYLTADEIEAETMRRQREHDELRKNTAPRPGTRENAGKPGHAVA